MLWSSKRGLIGADQMIGTQEDAQRNVHSRNGTSEEKTRLIGRIFYHSGYIGHRKRGFELVRVG